MMDMPDKCNIPGCFTMHSSRVTESMTQPKKDFLCPFLSVDMPMRCLRPPWACYQASHATFLCSRT